MLIRPLAGQTNIQENTPTNNQMYALKDVKTNVEDPKRWSLISLIWLSDKEASN